MDYSRNRNGSSLSTSKAASSRGSHVSIVDLLCNDPEANAVDTTGVIDRDALRYLIESSFFFRESFLGEIYSEIFM